MALIRFAIEHNAVEQDIPETNQEKDFLSRRMDDVIDFWNKHGTLLDPHPVYKVFKSHRRKGILEPLQWEMIQKLCKPLFEGRGDCRTDGDAEITWDDERGVGQSARQSRCDIVLVSQSLAEDVGLTSNVPCSHIPLDPEKFVDVVSWPRGIHYSCRMGEMKRIEDHVLESREAIKKFELVDDVWCHRFRPCVQQVKGEIVIIDGYAKSSILMDLLRRIDRDAYESCPVTIYSSKDEGPGSSFENDLKSLELKRIRSVATYLVQNYHLRITGGWDRFIRYDDHAHNLLHGADNMFGRKKVSSSGGKYEVVDENHVRRVEEDMRSQADSPFTVCWRHCSKEEPRGVRCKWPHP